MGGVLSNETDPWFSWQFDDGAPCPKGCARRGKEGKGFCEPVEGEGEGEGKGEL